jgi:hypothetical protein
MWQSSRCIIQQRKAACLNGTNKQTNTHTPERPVLACRWKEIGKRSGMRPIKRFRHPLGHRRAHPWTGAAEGTRGPSSGGVPSSFAAALRSPAGSAAADHRATRPPACRRTRTRTFRSLRSLTQRDAFFFSTHKRSVGGRGGSQYHGSDRSSSCPRTWPCWGRSSRRVHAACRSANGPAAAQHDCVKQRQSGTRTDGRRTMYWFPLA